MTVECNYQFRDAMRAVHASNRRDVSLKSSPGEVVIDDSWHIACAYDACETLRNAARDLQDYFFVSMNAAVRLGEAADKVIRLVIGDGKGAKGSFTLTVAPGAVTVEGNDPAGVFAGVVQIEDLCNLREAPYLAVQKETYTKLVQPRIVHSGYGIDDYPDHELAAIVHGGFDGIVVFVKGIDKTTAGHCDINNVIRRAKAYGLETMLYSYLPAYKHPDEADAKEFFEGIYTRLFETYPEAAGVMLVGESAGFPSKDPATTGKHWYESFIDGIPDPRPFPGWYPCEDYPDWLCMVRDAVRKAKPDAMIIFNTYNWGYVDEDLRRRFLERMPKDVIIQITFEIFKEVTRENLRCAVMDYTISECEPGFYFTSEAANAHKLGLPLLSTANTAGRTWDFGTAPYVPVPQQWMRKFKSLDHARRAWGVSRYYDNHHYGWAPSIITDLGRWYFRSPQVDMDELFDKLLVRDYGKEAAPVMKQAYDKWSEGIGYFTPTNEDQYGPFRTGPSYPLIPHPNITRTMSNKEIQFPTAEHAHFGHRIIKTFYQPYENAGQAPGSLRYPVELRSLRRMLELWREGVRLMEQAIAVMPERKKAKAERELNIGRFIEHSVVTGIHVKEWYMTNVKVMNASSREELNSLLDRIEELARAERANAEATIPVVEADSRLGWEPSMEYVCDRWHLEWKMRQIDSILTGEVAQFRAIVNLDPSK